MYDKTRSSHKLLVAPTFDIREPHEIITTKSFQVRPNPGNREPVICETQEGNFGNSVGLRNPGMEVALPQLEKLRQEISFIIEENNSPQDLAGKTFVITGSLVSFPNRDALKKVIEDRGGKVSGSVSAKTDYLINNDINSNSSKNKNAKKLGVPIITEEDFLSMK